MTTQRPTQRPPTITERLRSFAAPDARPPAFDAADVAYAVHDTAVGRILLGRNDSGALVASLYVPDDAALEAALERIAGGVSPRVLRQPHRLDEARRWLDAYLAGARHTGSPVTDLALATPFQRSVLTEVASRIGYGDKTTYAQVAGWTGRARAARAVGAALARNPVCVFVPCHRVVGAAGDLTGYAGGLEAKRALLALEARVRGEPPG